MFWLAWFCRLKLLENVPKARRRFCTYVVKCCLKLLYSNTGYSDNSYCNTATFKSRVKGQLLQNYFLHYHFAKPDN